jgi:copper chaperone CopZ
MQRTRFMVLATVLGMTTLSASAWAAEEKVTLKLGGTFCDLYLGEVETALKKMAGVKAVDFKAKRGHAVVTGESGTMNTGKLVNAVNGLKGDNWHCKAEVVK